jgi:hypothetical protein
MGYRFGYYYRAVMGMVVISGQVFTVLWAEKDLSDHW